jgi:hypothetical protein
LLAIIVVFIVVGTSNADLDLSHYPAKELPDSNLDSLDTDFVTKLDHYPMLVCFAWGKHVSVATLVKQRRRVLCKAGGRVNTGRTVW